MNLSGSLNLRWSRLLIEELYRHGITRFCIAPGSRSAPLTLAVSEHPGIKTSVHFDERGLAFFALGYGRATGKPAVVVTTSGTAVANLLPAVVEASVDEIPLILLTADRPPELRQTSANQTIDQIHLFGNYLRWQFDIPCPDPAIADSMILTTVAQSVAKANEPKAGPVQLNCMFREPLLPEKIELAVEEKPEVHRKDGKPYTITSSSQFVPPKESIKRIRDSLANSKSGIIVIGSLSSDADRKAAEVLSKEINWPICADITSTLRFSTNDRIISYADLILGSESFCDTVRPDTVLHLGGRFVSKRLQKFLERAKPDNYIQVNHFSERLDPGHLVSEHLHCHPATFVDAMCEETFLTQSSCLSIWQGANEQAARVISEMLDDSPVLSEATAARLVSLTGPKNSCLFLASSMPIRAMEMYSGSADNNITVAANRGASGIDGTIATASGFSTGRGCPVTCLIGDLGMLHDLNSLAMLKESEQPVIVVVFNNHGGGIFKHLPVATLGETFEKYFVTPHDCSFEQAALMFSLSYQSANSADEFKAVYSEALKKSESAIIELDLDMNEDYELHTLIAKRVSEAVDPLQ